MKKIILHVLTIWASIWLCNGLPATSYTKLVHISVIFRHGNRMPVKVFPNDPYDSKFWSKYGGLGELTPKGIKTEYDLGVALRQQYGFLNPTYSSNRVRVWSTDYDRTLVSAQAVMAGLFKPSADQKWNSALNWYPISVHSEPKAIDHIFVFANSAPCLYRQQLFNQFLSSKENQDYIQANQEYFKLMSKNSGVNSTGREIEMTHDVVDSLNCEIAEGLEIPQWARDNFSKFSELYYYAFSKDFKSPEALRMFAGAQLREIRTNLMNVVNGTTTYELYAFSSHDTLMAALTILLNTSLPRIQPPYGSALIFELRQDDAQKYYVRLMAKFNALNEPVNFQEVKIYECGDVFCPLEKFLEITSNKIITDIAKDCQIPSAS